MLVASAEGAGQYAEVSAEQCLESLVEQAMLTYHTTGEVPERRGLARHDHGGVGCIPVRRWLLDGLGSE